MLRHSSKWLPAALALTGLAFLGAPRTAHGVNLEFSAVITDTAGVIVPGGVIGPFFAGPTPPGGTAEINTGTFVADGISVTNGLHTANDALKLIDSTVDQLINLAAATRVINVVVSGNNFTSGAATAFTNVDGRFLNATGSSITATWRDDPANQLSSVTGVVGGMPVLTLAGNPVGVPFNFVATGPQLLAFANSQGPIAVNDPGNFGMSLVFTITLTPGATLQDRGQAEQKLPGAIPEIDPGSAASALTCLGSGVMILAGLRRKRTPA